MVQVIKNILPMYPSIWIREREMEIYALNFCPRKQDMKEGKNGGKKDFLLFLKFLYRAGFVHVFNKYTLIL